MHQTYLPLVSLFIIGLNVLPLNANQFIHSTPIVEVPGVAYVNYPEYPSTSYSDNCASEKPLKPLGAIDIDSKNVCIEEYSPLILSARLEDEMELKNNGRSLTLSSGQSCAKSFITGGPFTCKKYLLHSTEYRWTLDTNGTAGTTIDGKGYPLEHTAHLYLEKYGTFEKAMEYPDGVVLMHFFIDTGSYHNPIFGGYYKTIRQVIEAGSCTKATFNDAILWFSSEIPLNTTYYEYTSPEIDENSGRIYMATHIIISHLPEMTVSHDQFMQTFGSLLDCKGNQVSNSPPRSCHQTVQVKKIVGILNLLIP